eukprot:1250201-Prymnesium_polylepis.1
MPPEHRLKVGAVQPEDVEVRQSADRVVQLGLQEEPKLAKVVGELDDVNVGGLVRRPRDLHLAPLDEVDGVPDLAVGQDGSVRLVDLRSQLRGDVGEEVLVGLLENPEPPQHVRVDVERDVCGEVAVAHPAVLVILKDPLLEPCAGQAHRGERLIGPRHPLFVLGRERAELRDIGGDRREDGGVDARSDDDDARGENQLAILGEVDGVTHDHRQRGIVGHGVLIRPNPVFQALRREPARAAGCVGNREPGAREPVDDDDHDDAEDEDAAD